jgi:pimeloyl-ACP methyl ester carboxylesterase
MASVSAVAATIVLVHGGFVDGAGWEGVYNILKKDGYNVSIVQNPTASLADDVAVTRRVIAQAPGPVVLVGHSYGGVVVTEAGTDPKVAGVVYIAAFAPDKGESVQSLIANPPPGASVPPILPPVDGYLFLDRAEFRAAFAADVDAAKAALGRQRPLWRGDRARLEVEAKLVPGGDRGQDDSASRPAPDVEARRRDRHRSRGQPRDLCVEAGGRGCADCRSGEERERQSGGRVRFRNSPPAFTRRPAGFCCGLPRAR